MYKPNKSNIAGPLSRLIQETPPQPAAKTTHVEPKAIKLHEISAESMKDDMIQSVKAAIYDDIWNELATPF